MQQVKENTIYEIDRVDVRVLPDPLFYTEHNKPAIAENWRKAVAANSRLFDGEIYLAPEAHLDDRVFKASFRRTSFATLMYWRGDLVTEKPWHIFGVGIMVSAEGHLIAARMSAHNAVAGRIYFPAGSIDDHDIVGDRVNYEANMAREVFEETGMELGYAKVEPKTHLVTADGSIALFRRYYFDVPTAELLKRIKDNIAKQAEPELAEIIPVTRSGAMGEATPSYVRAFADWHFNNQQ
ncbi:NUDIX hydrolase [Ochrobactrum quorumnocens]|uniref:Putative nUDIX hydrolase n=1 Tax=Ochrobactrum quorumnocens TaxID=271865 RepID=A0A248UHF1_9HYPH|nr:NUDIX hydrolase [[Ochrobactrum] quorumnocens]ASV85709.1 putative nUDIX hydrolase [[Ochrobactrum] quorumnocens]MBD7989897.1 NUDIX hydrolase [Ochrobactrum gallinarum]